ncbi:CobW family GTP-binding protein [Mangrovibrevibacter kandeliae]|uniref:CobW family GTP-binding protein n=1 Tax=Mangrovibrevibacter kandeliae TaxID=2968473 RepID=UPI0021181AFC|nr:GTP-binding protein [Aurantimonas sp. CSK15Z-1]MCQ8782927.1 GTP-binding protein [Aurantimonas sp. CSK15Z-1]
MTKIPVFLLTGFLGAGKSTLLNRVLGDPAFADTAVIINEFGDVAIDHDLVRQGRSRVSRTTTGCLCCTIGSDIRSTLCELHELAAAGEASFSRVIVETTGLADPAPLVNELIPGGTPAMGLRDHLVARHFDLAGVVTLVDFVTGDLSIENHFEAGKQVAFADRIVLTKMDLARDPVTLKDIDALKSRLAVLNPAAQICDGKDPSALFLPRRYAPVALGEDVAGWLALETALRVEGAAHGAGGEASPPSLFDRHGGRIRTFTIIRDEPIAEKAIQHFLAVLTGHAGPRLLRAKGLIAIAENLERPLVVHAVQHVVYPPVRLEDWPSEDRRTRLVFITDGIDPEPVRELFESTLDPDANPFRQILAALGKGVSETLRSRAASLRLPRARRNAN